MKKIDVVKIDMQECEGIYNLYSEFISPERSERIRRIKPERDKILSFFAEIKMKNEISEYCGIPFKDIKFSYNSHGKPYLKDTAVNFSVSHSENLIAFAISEKAVGIDLEHTSRKPNMRVAERFFTADEYNSIINSENPDEEFYKIWTSKESYLKMIGTGLSKSLNSFDVLLDELKNYFFTEKAEKYILTVCYENALNENIETDFSDYKTLLDAVKEKMQFRG